MTREEQLENAVKRLLGAIKFFVSLNGPSEFAADAINIATSALKSKRDDGAPIPVVGPTLGGTPLSVAKNLRSAASLTESDVIKLARHALTDAMDLRRSALRLLEITDILVEAFEDSATVSDVEDEFTDISRAIRNRVSELEKREFRFRLAAKQSKPKPTPESDKTFINPNSMLVHPGADGSEINYPLPEDPPEPPMRRFKDARKPKPAETFDSRRVRSAPRLIDAALRTDDGGAQ